MKINYPGWELKFFDKAKFFRKYQFDLIKHYIKGVVAEVGPGNGTNIEYYRDKASNIDCFEPSKSFFIKLKKKFMKDKKIKINNSIFKKQEKKYNTILYLDVLEHIKSDEKEFLMAYDNLKKGGSIVINVPAFNFLFSKFDNDIHHHKRYIKKDFLKIIKKIKYKEKNIIYYDSVGFILSLLAKYISFGDYKKNFSKKIKLWNFLIPLSRIIDKIIFHQFGKSIICVVTKN